jgi:hypothetical protein
MLALPEAAPLFGYPEPGHHVESVNEFLLMPFCVRVKWISFHDITLIGIICHEPVLKQSDLSD